ncbi:uncharacterized protein [Rutidosis leptorrhynchoides]|uniref:uncharacterized protein n=1 Tax=Rutidosis leptorrhynchoides TaxID=125765 RepID=UPI003A999656
MGKDTPFDISYENEVNNERKGELDQRLVAAVCQEMMKLFQGKGVAENTAGMNHAVGLPYGTFKLVKTIGDVTINPNLTLHNVFYVPEFKLNLLSIGRLIRKQKLLAIFLPDYFLFQDLLTKKVVAAGKGFKNLYTCRATSAPATYSSSNSQNGIVERKHKHLLDTARALKFHAQLPNSFWGDYVLSATYLINKMPMENLDWKTPYEILHGYPPNQKGYKLFDLHTKTVFCSRDVIFREDTFPFKVSYTPIPTPSHIHSPVFSTPSMLDDNSDFDSMSSMPATHQNEQNGYAHQDTLIHHEQPNTTTTSAQSDIRRSTRSKHLPNWLKDFVTPVHVSNVQRSMPLYPLFQAHDFAFMSKDYIAFLANVMATSDPVTYAQACKDPKG